MGEGDEEGVISSVLKKKKRVLQSFIWFLSMHKWFSTNHSNKQLQFQVEGRVQLSNEKVCMAEHKVQKGKEKGRYKNTAWPRLRITSQRDKGDADGCYC